MLLISKLLVAAGGIGLVTSALTTSYSYLTRNYTIQELLKKESPEKVILKKGLADKSPWLDQWRRYINDNKEGNSFKVTDEWSLTNWNKEQINEKEVPEALAEKCEEKAKEQITGSKDPKYILFFKYCIK